MFHPPGFSILVEVEFEWVSIFCEKRKTGEPGEKPSMQGKEQ